MDDSVTELGKLLEKCLTEQVRKNPAFASGGKDACVKIGTKLFELMNSVGLEDPCETQQLAALELIASAIRFYYGQHLKTA